MTRPAGELVWSALRARRSYAPAWGSVRDASGRSGSTWTTTPTGSPTCFWRSRATVRRGPPFLSSERSPMKAEHALGCDAADGRRRHLLAVAGPLVALLGSVGSGGSGIMAAPPGAPRARRPHARA